MAPIWFIMVSSTRWSQTKTSRPEIRDLRILGSVMVLSTGAGPTFSGARADGNGGTARQCSQLPLGKAWLKCPDDFGALGHGWSTCSDRACAFDANGPGRTDAGRGHVGRGALRRHRRQPKLAGLFLWFGSADACAAGASAGPRRPDQARAAARRGVCRAAKRLWPAARKIARLFRRHP